MSDSTPLLSCPSCNYTMEQHIKHMERWCRGTPWEEFKPIVYRDKLTGKWVVECQCCGMMILFNHSTEEETVELWNKLPRET